MKEVTFEEYIEHKGEYRNGAVIPMAEHTIRRIGKLHEAQIKASESDKAIYHFVEIEAKETPRHVKALFVMQTIILLILVFKG